jgi:hypothetical protein
MVNLSLVEMQSLLSCYDTRLLILDALTLNTVKPYGGILNQHNC